MNIKRWGLFLLATCLVWLITTDLFAQVSIDVVSTTGAWPTDGRWFELSTRIENKGNKAIRGTIELAPAAGVSRSGNHESVFRTPFAVAGAAATIVRMPVWLRNRWRSALHVQAMDQSGNVLADQDVKFSPLSENDPTVLDACHPARVAASLGGADLSMFSGARLSRSRYRSPPVIKAFTAQTDVATGDVLLPASAAGYGGITMVFVHSKQLARLRGRPLVALASYIAAGASLGVIVDRPEDLRKGPLVSLVGGPIEKSTFAKAALRIPTYAIQRGSSGHRKFGKSTGTVASPKLVSPSEDVDKLLQGYQGGNLHPGIFGAAASYGLGEVLILALDPTISPASESKWVSARLLQLTIQAWGRQSSAVRLASLPGTNLTHETKLYESLDPNRRGSWAIVLVLLLLIAYSVVSGPVLFGMARKSHRPLRAVWQLPVLSIATFFLVVVIGLASKGCAARSSRLSLLETGAGMSTGGISRFRAFVTPSSRQLIVSASSPTGAVDLLPSPDGNRDNLATVEALRDGMRVRDLTTAPWRVQIVREEDTMHLPGSVTILKAADGQVEIVNRTGHTLRAAVLFLPSGSGTKPVFFARIEDGAHKRAKDGTTLAVPAFKGGLNGPGLQGQLGTWGDRLDHESSGLADGWRAMIEVMSSEAQWVPGDAPTLIAQVDGGEGQTSDSGMRIAHDRLLLRVVGYGGEL